jgi:hypothetical protein
LTIHLSPVHRTLSKRRRLPIMSSGPLCWHEEEPYEEAEIPGPECPSCRALSSSRRLRLWISGTITLWKRDSIAFATLIGSAIFIEDYDPYQSEALDLGVLGEQGENMGVETAGILPTCVRKLAKLPWVAVKQSKTLEYITVRTTQAIEKHQDCADTAAKSRIESILDKLHKTRLVEDPSPQLFLAACVFFAFAMAAVQHSHKADIYFNRILTMGMAVACLLAFQTSNVVMGLKRYLAWSIIFALLFSALFHWAVRTWKGPQTLENGPEMGIQLHDKSCDRKHGQEVVFQKSSRH